MRISTVWPTCAVINSLHEEPYQPRRRFANMRKSCERREYDSTTHATLRRLSLSLSLSCRLSSIHERYKFCHVGVDEHVWTIELKFTCNRFLSYWYSAQRRTRTSCAQSKEMFFINTSRFDRFVCGCGTFAYDCFSHRWSTRQACRLCHCCPTVEIIAWQVEQW